MAEKEKSSVHVAKPGTKLAQIQALGRRGGIHRIGGRSDQADGGPVIDSPSTAGPPPIAKRDTSVKQPSQKSGIAKGKTKPDKIKRAKAALAKASKKDGAGKKKPGPREKVGTPWKTKGISRATYYRELRTKSE